MKHCMRRHNIRTKSIEFDRRRSDEIGMYLKIHIVAGNISVVHLIHDIVGYVETRLTRCSNPHNRMVHLLQCQCLNHKYRIDDSINSTFVFYLRHRCIGSRWKGQRRKKGKFWICKTCCDKCRMPEWTQWNGAFPVCKFYIGFRKSNFVWRNQNGRNITVTEESGTENCHELDELISISRYIWRHLITSFLHTNAFVKIECDISTGCRLILRL